MVQLRSRSAALTRPPLDSLARSFSASKVDAKQASSLDDSKKNFKLKQKYQGQNREEVLAEKPKKRKTLKPTIVGNFATSEVAETSSPKKRKKDDAAPQEDLPFLARDDIKRATTIDFPRLPFDLQDAIAHLRSADPRFHELLDTVKLKPYIELAEGAVRELDLFKTLTTSILGQQVSWLAARVIVYRFCRLFSPDQLPEKHDFSVTPSDSLPFPHPLEVCQADENFLRSAGLSGAKARYVKDVARRFSDGRLDVRRIIELDEEACIAELVKINGVGRWTAEMLLMFALRRGNILPVGDLGVQRGMLHFFLASKKKSFKIDEKKKKKAATLSEDVRLEDLHDEDEAVPVVEEHLTSSQREVEGQTQSASEGVDIQQASAAGPSSSIDVPIPPLPQDIPMSLLQSRNAGKKAKGKLYLTPDEMDALSKPWQPYRSIGVYLMWAIVD